MSMDKRTKYRADLVVMSEVSKRDDAANSAIQGFRFASNTFQVTLRITPRPKAYFEKSSSFHVLMATQSPFALLARLVLLIEIVLRLSELRTTHHKFNVSRSKDATRGSWPYY